MVLPALAAPLLALSPVSAQAAPQDPMTMPIEPLERMAPDEHPAAYFVLAQRTFDARDTFADVLLEALATFVQNTLVNAVADHPEHE